MPGFSYELIDKLLIFAYNVLVLDTYTRRRFVTDTKFSSAIHTLILISESEKPLTSEEIAASVGTNASYIRKIIGLLKKKDIIESRRGVSGFILKPDAEELTLLQIYQAVNETETPHIFDLHQNPSDECIVGRHIKPVLTEMFAEIEDTFSRALAEKTLADCIRLIWKRL